MSVYLRGNTWWYAFEFRGARIQESSHSEHKDIAMLALRKHKEMLWGSGLAIPSNYGLYEQQGEQLVRLFPHLAFKLSAAKRIFQDQLLAPVLYGIDGVNIKGFRDLRPVAMEAEK